MANTAINFLRCRNGAGDPVWTFNIKQDGTLTYEEESTWVELDETLEAYFDYAGFADVEVSPGVQFPGGHGALIKISDDLYFIERETSAPEPETP